VWNSRKRWDHVPGQSINRPKMGFAIHRATWLRGELKDLSYDLLTDGVAKDRDWFDQRIVKNSLEAHAKGSNLDSVIWPMIMLELWSRNWLD